MDEESKKDIIYKRFESQIAREDKLINSRLSWLNAFQGFLVAALTFLVEKEEFKDTLMRPILFLGLVCSIATLVSIGLASCAFKNLHQEWDKKALNITPSPFGFQIPNKGYYFNLLGPGSIIPLSTMIFWIYLLFKAF